GTRARPNAFLGQLESFMPALSFFGAINSLAQRLLMITSPGNPDLYQGMELWDFSLVDPDNRRPVDYALRERMLAELDRPAEAGASLRFCAELLANFQDGRIKLWTTVQALRHRRQHRRLFHSGAYVPLEASGARRQHAVAFSRESNGQIAIVVVPRLSYSLAGGALRAPLGELWEDTEVPAPARAPEFLENVLTAERVRVTPQRTLLCGEVFAAFPVALLAGG